jgi:predicted transcriptional regulator
MDPQLGLSAREREITDIVFRLRKATAADVAREMAEPPSNATIRSALRVLEGKGHLRHSKEGARYVYESTRSRERVRRDALGHLLNTFFDGSPADAFAALVDRRKSALTDREKERIRKIVEDLDSKGG